jgi:hypothetical protein
VGEPEALPVLECRNDVTIVLTFGEREWAHLFSLFVKKSTAIADSFVGSQIRGAQHGAPSPTVVAMAEWAAACCAAAR